MSESIVCNARPSFFRACIYEARRHPWGYGHAGYELARHIHRLTYGELDDDAEMALADAVDAHDGPRVVAWLRQYMPRCMAMVPRARVATFTRGVERAIDDEILTP